MSKPAARIGDQHICPKVTPGTPPIPHVGGPVSNGCLTVLINNMPAARVGDSCTCLGEPDKVVTGSSGVFIGGKPAARMGDQTAHGGKIMVGCVTVVIGEKMILRISEDVRTMIINNAIEKSVALLENKMHLLEQNDIETLNAFKTWFGQDDERSKMIILERIRNIYVVSKKLSVENFKTLSDKKAKSKYAEINLNDEFLIIFLGDKFWTSPKVGKDSRSGVLIHELSHLNDIGETLDYMRGESDCLVLAGSDPSEALYNADSFEYFIEI